MDEYNRDLPETDNYEQEEAETEELDAIPVTETVEQAESELVAETDAAPVPEPSDAEAFRDDEYRPEAQRGAYSDAGYVAAADAVAVPKSYCCTAPAEKKEKKAKKERRGMRAAGVIALCLVCAILGGLAAGFLPGLIRGGDRYSDNGGIGTIETRPAAPADPADADTVINVASPAATTVKTRTVASGEELSPTEIYYDLALKQVVGVTTEITYTNYFGFTSSGAVSGSGFIISPDGYILTNYHVIEDAVKGGYDVKILTYDGDEYVASVVGYEEDNDVAVLKIDATGLSAATIGDSDEMMVGQSVYAVGNPLGELEYTMTDGMVSALDREISSQDSMTGQTKTINMFQISAAINSGNSGGPVYNTRGEVIGIATAKYSDTGIEGLGFAIPINDAIKIARDLISDGYVRGKAHMGVSLGTVTASAAQYYGLVEGAIVASVSEGSCAEKAGLQESDIIVACDDKTITSRNDMVAAKKDYRAGDSAVLKIYRGGEYLELTIVFDEETPAVLEAETSTQNDDTQNDDTQNGQAQVELVPAPDDGFRSFDDFFNDFFGGYPFRH